jgi:hypothetical protein
MITSSLRYTLFFSTARVIIESRTVDGLSTQLDPAEIGTAFIVEPPSGATYSHYLVTARHVVQDAEAGSLIFLRQKQHPDDPNLFEFSSTRLGELWYYPTDLHVDVAIMPLFAGEIAANIQAASVTIFGTPFTDYRREYDSPRVMFVGPFEEVLFVGYPLGFWDPNSGAPIVRRGITATPTNLDYRGEPAFLIDGAVYPGSSGGPVIVIESYLSPYVLPDSADGHPREEERFIFLGMITDIYGKTRGAERIAPNLGHVLKARVIFDVIREYEALIRGHGHQS